MFVGTETGTGWTNVEKRRYGFVALTLFLLAIFGLLVAAVVYTATNGSSGAAAASATDVAPRGNSTAEPSGAAEVAQFRNSSGAGESELSKDECPMDCVQCCVVDTTALNVPVRIAGFVDVLPCAVARKEPIKETFLKPKPVCVRPLCGFQCTGFFHSKERFLECYSPVNATR